MARRNNVLYGATAYNMPLFMPEEKKDAFIEELPKQPSERRKGVLHKVNAYNKAAFMPKEEKRENLFFDAGQMNNVQTTGLGSTNFASSLPSVGGGLDFNAGKALGNAMSAGSSGGAGLLGGLGGGFGASFLGAAGNGLNFNGLSGLGSSLGSAVGSSISGIGSAVGGAIGGLIGGGYESGVGNAMSSIGKMASVIPGPWGAAISGGLQVLGGGVNALFGTKVDQKKLQAANKGTAEYNNFISNATNFDDIKTATAQQNVQDAYSGGAFRKGWAREKNKKLHEQRVAARQFASRSVANNISNLISDQISDALANFSAYGGPLTRRRKTRRMLTI